MHICIISKRMSYSFNGKMHVNKYWIDIHSWLFIPLYSFDTDSALQNKLKLVNMVCFHWSMPGRGNKEPGNYTHIIPLPKCMFLSKFFFPFGPSLKHIAKFRGYDVCVYLLTQQQLFWPASTLVIVIRHHAYCPKKLKVQLI